MGRDDTPFKYAYENGECTRCWACCTSTLLPSECVDYPPFEEKDIDWIWMWIRCRLKDVRHIRKKLDWKYLVVTKFQICQFLTIDDDYNPTCIIYEARPKLCKDYYCWEDEDE